MAVLPHEVEHAAGGIGVLENGDATLGEDVLTLLDGVSSHP